MNFPVTYNGMPFAGGFSVGYQTADTTAIGYTGSQADADYIAQSNSLSFSGTPGETKFIVISVLGDYLVEMAEYFRVELTSVSKPGIGLSGYAGGTIGNDDNGVISIINSPNSPSSVVEDDRISQQIWETFSFDITLNLSTDIPIDVWYQVMPTGVEQADIYTPAWIEQHTTLTYANQKHVVVVEVRSDDIVEPSESFQMRITRIDAHGRQVSVGGNGPSGTIVDNDKFRYVVDDLAQPEGTSVDKTDFNVTIRALNKVEGGVTVTLATNEYTAGVDEDDYDFKQAAFTFTETGPQSFTMTVKVKADPWREANEKFTVTTTTVQGLAGFSVPVALEFGIMPWGLITIQNDDEGEYTNTGGGRVAFYNSAATGVDINSGIIFNLGAGFKWAAEHEYAVSYDVASPAAMYTALRNHVIANGRVSEIAIFEHGNPSAQYIGGIPIDKESTEEWAPLCNDGLYIRFLGCEVGQNQQNGESLPSGNVYCDWVCDDAAPAATVKASETKVRWNLNYFPDGSVMTTTYIGAWIDFDGFQKKR
jgi:Calx-beta domain